MNLPVRGCLERDTLEVIGLFMVVHPLIAANMKTVMSLHIFCVLEDVAMFIFFNSSFNRIKRWCSGSINRF